MNFNNTREKDIVRRIREGFGQGEGDTVEFGLRAADHHHHHHSRHCWGNIVEATLIEQLGGVYCRVI